MGVLRRLGKLVVEGVKSANREASHPGRPPSYHATDSKFWKEPADKAEKTREAARRMAEAQGDKPVAVRAAPPKAAPAKAPSVVAPPPAEETEGEGNLRGEEEALPWYLEGQEDVDGWDSTNGRDADD